MKSDDGIRIRSCVGRESKSLADVVTGRGERPNELNVQKRGNTGRVLFPVRARATRARARKSNRGLQRPRPNFSTARTRSFFLCGLPLETATILYTRTPRLCAVGAHLRTARYVHKINTLRGNVKYFEPSFHGYLCVFFFFFTKPYNNIIFVSSTLLFSVILKVPEVRFNEPGLSRTAITVFLFFNNLQKLCIIPLNSHKFS